MSQLDAAVSLVYAELAAAKGDESNVDQRGDVARLAHRKSVFWVGGATHECRPVVLKAVTKDSEDHSAKRGYHRAAAGCYYRSVRPSKQSRSGQSRRAGNEDRVSIRHMHCLQWFCVCTHQGRCQLRGASPTLFREKDVIKRWCAGAQDGRTDDERQSRLAMEASDAWAAAPASSKPPCWLSAISRDC